MINKIQKVSVEEVGNNTWKDARGNVYIVNKDKTAFLKMDKKQFGVWQVLNMRIVTGFIVAFLIDYYFQSLLIGVALGFAVYGLIELYYRFKFLPGLPEIGKIKNPDELKNSGFFIRFDKSTKKELLKRFLMLAILDALLILNFIKLNYKVSDLMNFTDVRSSLNVWIYAVFIIGITIFALVYLIAWIRKKD